MNKYKVRTIECLGCKQVITKRMPANRTYCSLVCYRASKRPKRMTGGYRQCGLCGKDVYVTASTKKTINYCSIKCHDLAQCKKISYTCKTCGKTMKWSPSRTKQHTPKYCSIDCRNRCEEWKFNAVIAGNLKQQNSKAPTSLETKGAAILDSIGVGYEVQKLICNKFVVDAYIPDCNLVIQWDGDYWHGYNGVKDARQKKRKALDISQDAYMKKAGYVVKRYWEHEVNNKPKEVYDNIKSTIQQLAGAVA